MLNSVVKKITFFNLLLFLSCLNFMGSGNIIFFILCLYVFINYRHDLYLDGLYSFSSILMGVVIFCVSFYFYDITDLIKSINYIFAYTVGLTCYRHSNNKISFIKNTCITIFLGSATQVLLIYLYNLYKGQTNTRILYGIWNVEFISVTLLALISTIIIGFAFFSLFCEKNTFLKYITIFSVAVAFVLAINTATRTLFVLTFLCFIICSGVYFKLYRKLFFRKILLPVCFLLLVFIPLCLYDLFHYDSYILNSPIYMRFFLEGLDSPRYEISTLFIDNILLEPLGGGKLKGMVGIYAHNLPLEMYDVYGVVCFVAIMVLYIKSLWNVLILAKYKIKNDINFLLIGFILSIDLEMLLEPIIEGYPLMLWLFLLLLGITNSFVREGKYYRGESD